MQDDVAIAVRDDTAAARYPHAAQHDGVSGTESVNVETRTDAHQEFSSGARALRMAAASFRSSAVVTLMLSARPATSRGRKPSHSTACASSVGVLPAASAASSARDR